MIVPRDYQVDAVDAPLEYYASGGTGNTLVAAPTGVGKSIMIALLIKRVFDLYGFATFMVLTHSKELIAQDYAKLMELWPTAPAGIFSAGLGRKDTKHPIIIGGIGSVANCPEWFEAPDFILVDEAHSISAKEAGQYRAFINYQKTRNPNLIVIGYTATKFRMGQGLLTEGDTPLFESICIDMTTMEAFNWFLDEGFLCRLRPIPTETEYDVTGVKIVAGEYHQGQLQEAVDKDELTRAVVAEAIRLGENRQSWLVFASGVKHCVHVAQELMDQGIITTYVHSNTKDFLMTDEERDQRIIDFKLGKYQAIVSNGILTTGFDHPPIDYIVMLKKTKSIVLWIQMLGRGTRPWYLIGYDLSTREGRLEAIMESQKPYCLVADFAGNCKELGPINDPQIPKPKGKKQIGDAPIKICPDCGTYNHAGNLVCDHCGREFPRVLQINLQAATDQLIREKKAAEELKIEVKLFNVTRVEYHPHFKVGSPAPSIRVSYYCGLRRFTEWVNIQHPGSVGTRAKNWWRARTNIEPPATTPEALMLIHHLIEPTALHVRLDTKYPTIINYDFKTE